MQAPKIEQVIATHLPSKGFHCPWILNWIQQHYLHQMATSVTTVQQRCFMSVRQPYDLIAVAADVYGRCTNVLALQCCADQPSEPQIALVSIYFKCKGQFAGLFKTRLSRQHAVALPSCGAEQRMGHSRSTPETKCLPWQQATEGGSCCINPIRAMNICACVWRPRYCVCCAKYYMHCESCKYSL